MKKDWSKARGLRRKANRSDWATLPLRHTDGGQEERRVSQRELATGLKLTQPAVSQALRIMIERYEGIVEADKIA